MSNEVISAQQTALLDRIKAYDAAEEKSIHHRKAYAYLKGRTAMALKDTCDHGQFVSLLQSSFTENKVRWVQYCMTFAEAIESGKNAPSAFLPDTRLIGGSATLSLGEETKLVDAVARKTGDHGIKAVIAQYKKKVRKKEKLGPDGKPEKQSAVEKQKEREKNLAAKWRNVELGLKEILRVKDIDRVLVPKAHRRSVVALAQREIKREQEFARKEKKQ